MPLLRSLLRRLSYRVQAGAVVTMNYRYYSAAMQPSLPPTTKRFLPISLPVELARRRQWSDPTFVHARPPSRRSPSSLGLLPDYATSGSVIDVSKAACASVCSACSIEQVAVAVAIAARVWPSVPLPPARHQHCRALAIHSANGHRPRRFDRCDCGMSPNSVK